MKNMKDFLLIALISLSTLTYAQKFSVTPNGLKDAANLENIAILRLERLYPLPLTELKSALSNYSNDVKIIWAQDEPANQGAFPFVITELAPHLGRIITRVSRPASSAPAVGSHTKHDQEQSDLIKSVIE